MSAADPRDLAARPAFAQFVAALRGGEGPCPRCGPGEWPTRVCKHCSGSGRVAVPPDPEAGPALADWWEEGGVAGGSTGGDLAVMLWCYALPPEWLRPTPTELHALPAGTRGRHDPRTGRNYVIEPSDSDDSLRPALLALTERDVDPRVRALAVAARGLRVERVEGEPGEMRWCVIRPPALAPAGAEWHPTEPAARLALKAAVLTLFDPLVRVPCRAEGARLTVRQDGREREMGPALLMLGKKQVYHSAGVYLDGVRVGAPPDWSWTPHKLPCGRCRGSGDTRGPGKLVVRDCPGCGGSGYRLAVKWECRPSDLLPAAGADAEPRPEPDPWWPTDEELRNLPGPPPGMTHGPLTG